MKILSALVVLAALFAGTWLLYARVGHEKAPMIYDESADARAVLKSAFASAKTAKKPMFVLFGANWCKECRALDQAMKQDPTAALISQSFIVVKVNVGKFDRNMDLSLLYGNITKKGIPAGVLFSPVGDMISQLHPSELLKAKQLGTTGIYDFLSDLAQRPEGS